MHRTFTPVDENLPSVTVLIAARPGQAEVKAVPAAQALDYPPDKLEIIVARGKQPSAQRNAAMKAAHGELLFFLDDDSVALPDSLRHALNHFTRPEVALVGGPNLCPPDAPALEQVFALVLSSWLAFGPSRARYAQVGPARETSEKELILCNLVARRETMLRLGGFNEALYPNEENALMDELQKSGAKLVYEPQMIVHRRPRRTLRAFARMLMTYGRGRAEQFRLHPTPGSALNFVPPAFLVYLILTAVLLAAAPTVGKLFATLLALYAGAVLGQAAVLALMPPLQAGRKGSWGTRLVRSAAAIPFIVLTHLLYGFGFWRGLFTPLKPDSRPVAPPVVLETVAP